MGDVSQHFNRGELQCKCGCGEMQLADGFIDELEGLRVEFGKPMKINSCCRCVPHNRAVGGADGSLHQMEAEDKTGIDGCCAADVNTVGWTGHEKWTFIGLAIKRKWSFGVSKTFIHIDRRADHQGSPYYGQPSNFPY